MSQLESLKSMLEQSVSLNNQRTKELHTEQNSMRQKLNGNELSRVAFLKYKQALWCLMMAFIDPIA